MRVWDGVLILVGLVVVWSLVRAHRNPAVDINLFDLVMENGRLSKVSVGYMVTLVVSSWVLIRAAYDSKSLDIIYAAYGAMWVTPLIAKIFALPSGASTTTDTSKTTHTETTT